MDDLSALRRLHDDVAAPDLTAARHRLMNRALAPEPAPRSWWNRLTASSPTVGGRPSARVRPGGAALGRLVAAAAALAVLLTGVQLLGGGPAVSAEAAQVLNSAADALATARERPVGPGRYLHRVQTTTYVQQGRPVPGQAVTAEAWIPGDPAKDWITRSTVTTQGKTEVRALERAAGGRFPGWQTGGWTGPTPAFLATLPRDPDLLLAKLRHETGDDDEAMFAVVRALTEYSVHPPVGVRVALLRAAARIPGVEVTDRAVAMDGRTGIALRRGATSEIVIDPATGEVIGMREQRGPDETSPWTVLRTEVVDTAPGAP